MKRLEKLVRELAGAAAVRVEHPSDAGQNLTLSEADISEICEGLRGLASAGVSYQDRVHAFMMACFGAEIAKDLQERNHRFLEESLELVQSTGCTASEAHQLVDYVFGRPVGVPHQECGGVAVTLAALCNAAGIGMPAAAEDELTRVNGKMAEIRAKQAAKPKHSPLPYSKVPMRCNYCGCEKESPMPAQPASPGPNRDVALILSGTVAASEAAVRGADPVYGPVPSSLSDPKPSGGSA